MISFDIMTSAPTFYREGIIKLQKQDCFVFYICLHMYMCNTLTAKKHLNKKRHLIKILLTKFF